MDLRRDNVCTETLNLESDVDSQGHSLRVPDWCSGRPAHLHIAFDAQKHIAVRVANLDHDLMPVVRFIPWIENATAIAH